MNGWEQIKYFYVMRKRNYGRLQLFNQLYKKEVLSLNCMFVRDYIALG